MPVHDELIADLEQTGYLANAGDRIHIGTIVEVVDAEKTKKMLAIKVDDTRYRALTAFPNLFKSRLTYWNTFGNTL